MKRGNKPSIDEPSAIESTIVTKLNAANDHLFEIQFMTSFLATAVTDLSTKEYSEDYMFGAKLCFGLLDKRVDEVLGDIEEIITEVKRP